MSQTLLRRIQDAATDPTSDLPSLLRLCMMLASRLRNETLKTWADAELNGYGEKTLPDYRVIPAFSKLSIRNQFQGSGQIQIPRIVIEEVLGAEIAEKLSCARVTQSIAEISGFASTDSGSIGIVWPHEMVMLVAPHVSEWEAIGAKIDLPRQKLLGILDIVRTRVLKFALELEEQDPTLGEATAPTGAVAERIQQIVNQTFNISGPYASVNAPISQVATPEQRLRSTLADEGLTPDEVETVTALAVQEKKPQGVLAKMKKLGGALAQKAAEAGVVEAIKQFLGA